MPIDTPMEWTNADALGLSDERCTYCEGTGLRPGPHRNGKAPCNCVLRAIFHACLNRFQYCSDLDAGLGAIRCSHAQGVDSSMSWTRVMEDFQADFCLIAKRVLSEDEFWIFRLHFLEGFDWRACSNLLKIGRGVYFHAVYRIEQKLGRAYREVRPYPLFPVDEYFGGTIRKAIIALSPCPPSVEVA